MGRINTVIQVDQEKASSKIRSNVEMSFEG